MAPRHSNRFANGDQEMLQVKLTISDPKSQSTVIVEVKAGDSGSTINLPHGRKAPAKG